MQLQVQSAVLAFVVRDLPEELFVELMLTMGRTTECPLAEDHGEAPPLASASPDT